MTTNDAAMSFLVYGKSKQGKSTLSLTTPAPRLILDTESAARFLKTKKVYWDPTRDAPPEDDGTWETCIVSVDNIRKAKRAYEYLKAGKHPFNSVILDSISELQEKVKGETTNRSQPKIQEWGTIGAEMAYLAGDLRDLTTNAVQPVKSVLIVATSTDPRYDEHGNIVAKGRPAAQGSFKEKVQYYFDAVGYVYLADVPDENGEVQQVQCLQVKASDKYEVGTRAPDLPNIIAEPNINDIVDEVFAE